MAPKRDREKDTDLELRLNTIRLEIQRLSVGAKIDLEMRTDFIAERFRKIVLYMCAPGALHQVTPKSEWVPVSWWDAVKAAFVPTWLKRWFPVSRREIKKCVRITHICPHIGVPPKDRRHLDFVIRPPLSESSIPMTKEPPSRCE